MKSVPVHYLKGPRTMIGGFESTNNINVIWALKPCYLGPGTLRVIFIPTRLQAPHSPGEIVTFCCSSSGLLSHTQGHTPHHVFSSENVLVWPKRSRFAIAGGYNIV